MHFMVGRDKGRPTERPKEFVGVGKRHSSASLREEKDAGERARERCGPGRSEGRLCEDELQRGDMVQTLNWNAMTTEPEEVAEGIRRDVFTEEPDGRNVHVRFWRGAEQGNLSAYSTSFFTRVI
jgi:hypothetical protein